MQLERINKKIAEVEGTVDSNMMQNLQNKMQVLNEELQQAKNEKPKLEKQLKSLDVSVKSSHTNTVEILKF